MGFTRKKNDNLQSVVDKQKNAIIKLVFFGEGLYLKRLYIKKLRKQRERKKNMKRLLAALFGTLIVGTLNANIAKSSNVDIDTAREARIEKIRAVTAESPLSFAKSLQSNRQIDQWHSSHSSHRSHSSHFSHQSHRSGW